MNNHADIQIRLIYDELRATERRRLQTHVATCPECEVGARAIRHDREIMQGFERFHPRPGLEEELVRSATRATDRRTTSRIPRLGIGIIAALTLALVVAMVDLLSPGQTVAPVGAETILRQALEPAQQAVPSRGTAYVSFRKLSSDQLPVNAAASLGSYLKRVNWVVRDRTHFRYDITTITPRLDAGTTTVVVRGTHVQAYDSETGLAMQQSLPSHGLTARLSGYMTELRFAGAWSALPDPIGSIRKNLTRLASDSRTGMPGHVQAIGHQRLAGRRVSVFDVRPAVWAQGTQPCYLTPGPTGTYPSESHCRKVTRGYGWTRLWIDPLQRSLLKYQEFGFPQVENPAAVPSDYLFRVQTIQFGPQPLSSLRYAPPVAPIHVASQVGVMPLMDTGGGDLIRVPARFLAVPYPQLPIANPMATKYGFPGLLKTYGFDVVWRHAGPGQIDGSPPIQTHWFHGSYLFLQQRWRPHGLPSFYRPGAVTSVGRCTVWTGQYPTGGRWMSLQHGSLAIVVSTGGLKPRALRAYVQSLSICAPPHQ